MYVEVGEHIAQTVYTLMLYWYATAGQEYFYEVQSKYVYQLGDWNVKTISNNTLKCLEC